MLFRSVATSAFTVVVATSSAARLLLVVVVVEPPAVAVDDEAEHARSAQETVPRLLPVVLLTRSLVHAVTMLGEEMAHIEDTLGLWAHRHREQQGLH